tara:strand:+ start:323 stop:703 length:381 start_codon:yes stop_codon:yes gene_type:complete
MMTQEEALIRIEAMRAEGNKTKNAAIDLCLHDIQAEGLEDWLQWDSLDVATTFSEMTDDAVTDLIEEINSKQAGQVLIDEVLGVEQDRIDTLETSKKLAMASARMFKVLVKYIAIHEYMKLSLHAR